MDFVTLAERIRGLGRLALVYTAPNDGATITELQWPSDADEPTAERVARLATMHGLGTPINFEAYDSGLYGMMVEIHHEPVNRSEVLFPLLHAYPLAPSSGSRQAQKLFDWADRLNGLAKTLGVHVDPLSFTPFWGIKGPTRRTARGTGTLAIFPGQRLSYDEMTRVPLPRNNLYGVGGTGSRQPIDPARPVMTDGFDLTPWFGDYGRRFLILYCLRASGWDFDPPVTEVGERARAAVRCPNAGGEAVGEHTCVARNPDGEGRPFEMYCEHPSCRGLGTLEMLALLEQASLVPLGSDSFSHFLCKTEFYLADPADVLGLPRVTRAKYLSRPVI